jgi:hypothetical protein
MKPAFLRNDRANIGLHSDYINPIDLCNRLNTYIVPEAAVHAFLTFLFLINGYWLALILNLPLLGWNAKKYASLAYLNKSRCRHTDGSQPTGSSKINTCLMPLRSSANSMSTRR